ncbi:uncharacterized protein LOC111693506 [Trichogramma pretiosum]|uniref:uncharacterized protein LOC111693506 n=1 Tax=Trichogramma pretiosum TaxID=7493 RepID=UPI000C718C08|nr:uncharacterized protein LOC111693506 [Trichogramma pretiosum]
MFKYVVFGLLVASAIATPAPSSGLDCNESDDQLTCLAVKAAATLERAARSADIEIIDGVTLVRDTPVERTGKALKSESEIMSELPADSTEKAMAVATMMYDNAVNFLQSHSLNVDMSEARHLDVDDIFSHSHSHLHSHHSPSKKHKKLLSPLLSIIGVKLFALAPFFLGKLALAVGKAIFFSKVALLITGVLLFQKFFGSASQLAGGFPGGLFGKNNVTPQYNYEPATYAQAGAGAYSAGYQRSLDAQQLAYSTQAPAQ